MVIPRLFIERPPRLTKRGWEVTTHVRPRSSIFTRVRKQVFPTEQEALQWSRDQWMAGNPSMLAPGKVGRRRSTQDVLWIYDQMVLTGPYAGLPDFRVIGTGIWIAGQQVATTTTDGRPLNESTRKSGTSLKRTIMQHPLGACLATKLCIRCGRQPRLNLTAGTLSHQHPDCDRVILMPPDPVVGIVAKVALWNRFFAGRKRPTKLVPVSRAHYMILGVLREPSERDIFQKIRGVEVFSIDEGS